MLRTRTVGVLFVTSTWDIYTGNPEHDRRNMSVLMESVLQLYDPQGADELPRHAVDRAILVTGAERGILLLDLGDGPVPVVARTRSGDDLPLDLRYSRGMVNKVWTTGKPHQELDAEDQAKVDPRHSVLDLKLLSIMATPLTARGQRIGILYVDSKATVKEFKDADYRVFNALGAFIALAVENQRLLVERIEKDRMSEQIGRALEVQRRLLPVDPQAPSGYEIAGGAQVCEDLSGDYYDVIPLRDGRVALVVGDVSGHGTRAALYMASTRALIHALLGEGSDALKVVETLNRFLARDMADDEFMSLFIGILEPTARTLTYGSAGHNPPLLVRADAGIDELRCTGPVLAVFEDAPYRLSGEIPLGRGDALVLYTDGIYEAHNGKNEIYGEERFHASLEAHVRAGKSAEDVKEGLFSDLDAFRGAPKLEDDVTCLILRVL